MEDDSVSNLLLTNRTEESQRNQRMETLRTISKTVTKFVALQTMKVLNKSNIIQVIHNHLTTLNLFEVSNEAFITNCTEKAVQKQKHTLSTLSKSAIKKNKQKQQQIEKKKQEQIAADAANTKEFVTDDHLRYESGDKFGLCRPSCSVCAKKQQEEDRIKQEEEDKINAANELKKTKKNTSISSNGKIITHVRYKSGDKEGQCKKSCPCRKK